MEIAKIALLETENLNRIYLYKEGSFWKTYERSAYMFINSIKPYQTKKRYYKNLKQDIVSVGFPDTALENAIADRKILSKQEKEAVLELDDVIDINHFERWKKTLPVYEKKEALTGKAPGNVEDMIRNFDLSNATPVACVNFLAELKTYCTQPESG